MCERFRCYVRFYSHHSGHIFSVLRKLYIHGETQGIFLGSYIFSLDIHPPNVMDSKNFLQNGTIRYIRHIISVILGVPLVNYPEFLSGFLKWTQLSLFSRRQKSRAVFGSLNVCKFVFCRINSNGMTQLSLESVPFPFGEPGSSHLKNLGAYVTSIGLEPYFFSSRQKWSLILMNLFFPVNTSLLSRSHWWRQTAEVAKKDCSVPLFISEMQ